MNQREGQRTRVANQRAKLLMKTGAKADPAAVDAVVPWKALSAMKGTETLDEYIGDTKDEFCHEIVPVSKPYLTSKHVKSVAGLKTAKYCKKCCRHATLSSRSTWGGSGVYHGLDGHGDHNEDQAC